MIVSILYVLKSWEIKKDIFLLVEKRFQVLK